MGDLPTPRGWIRRQNCFPRPHRRGCCSSGSSHWLSSDSHSTAALRPSQGPCVHAQVRVAPLYSGPAARTGAGREYSGVGPSQGLSFCSFLVSGLKLWPPPPRPQGARSLSTLGCGGGQWLLTDCKICGASQLLSPQRSSAATTGRPLLECCVQHAVSASSLCP